MIKSKRCSSKCYVGSAVKFNQRWNQHKCSLRANKHDSPKLQLYVNKYGIDDLDFVVLEECDRNLLLEREQYYIDSLDPYFNICKVAGNCYGVKQSEEAKQKRSMSLKGRPSPMKGRHHTQEAKDKIGNFNKGKKYSSERRKNISNAKKCKLFSVEHKQHLSSARMGKSPWNKGIPMSDESKQKMINSKKEKRESLGVSIAR